MWTITSSAKASRRRPALEPACSFPISPPCSSCIASLEETALNQRSIRIAIVYPGDPEARRLATRENNRFAALFAAFASRGVDAQPAVYNREQAGALRDQL